MVETVTIHEAKTHLSRLIKAVLSGREIVIARGREPVAKLVPIAAKAPKRQPGAWKGRVWAADDAFAPMSDDEIAAWEGSGGQP
jgi:prevent-host-death family protein